MNQLQPTDRSPAAGTETGDAATGVQPSETAATADSPPPNHHTRTKRDDQPSSGRPPTPGDSPTTGTRPTTILIVDDHPIVREGLGAVLEDRPGLRVVGAVGSAEAALPVARRERPDVVLLDLELPGLGGLDAIAPLLAAAPETRIIVLTAYESDERVVRAVQAGARGYLLKGATGAQIAHAVETVRAGGSALDPRAASRLLSRLQSRHPDGIALSERERQVLALLREGLANKQIARRLGIAERTVKFHVTSLLNKLGADNRTRAVALAAELGL